MKNKTEWLSKQAILSFIADLYYKHLPLTADKKYTKYQEGFRDSLDIIYSKIEEDSFRVSNPKDFIYFKYFCIFFSLLFLILGFVDYYKQETLKSTSIVSFCLSSLFSFCYLLILLGTKTQSKK